MAMPYSIDLAVQPDDIDELGHASNLAYLRWVIDAARAHSAHVGMSQTAYLARRQAFVVRRHEIDYLRAAGPGELLKAETRVASWGAASSTRRTRILRAADGVVLARCTTDWAYFDLDRQRVIRIPEDVRACYALEPDVPA